MIGTNALSNKLDVWGFEDGKLIFKDFSLGTVLEVSQRDISTAPDELLNSLKTVICDFLNGLPSGLFLQFVQVVAGNVSEVIDRHEAFLIASAPELASKLLQDRTKRLRARDNDGEVPNQKLYLVLRKPFVKTRSRERRSLKFWEKKDEGFRLLENLRS